MQRATEDNPQPDTPKKANRQKSSVGLRLLTALIAIPVVLLFVWFGGWWAFAGTVIVVVITTYELHNMLHHSGYHPMIPVSLGLSILILVAAMLPGQQLLLLEIGFSASLLVSFPLLFFRKNLDGSIVDWSLTLVIAVYVGFPLSFFLLLRGYDASVWQGFSGMWVYLPRGVWWLLLVFLGVWGFDAAAFFTGRSLGRHKLAPRISPGKTWEGVLGGFVLSIVAALALTVRQLGVPWYLAIVLGILLGVASVLGDLAESLIKRQMHVKDSGHFMPGHGGLLDRVDSLLFAVIVVYFFALIVGL
ncbi:MAG: phosphatidate cytidylyltransferase [Ktedonobacteraceae bacterium]